MIDNKPEDVRDNIVGVAWFNDACCCIAIIIGWYPSEGENGEMIGRIAKVMSHDQEEDIIRAYEYGGRFPLNIASDVIDTCGGWLKPDKTIWRPKEKSNSPLRFKVTVKPEALPKLKAKIATKVTEEEDQIPFYRSVYNGLH